MRSRHYIYIVYALLAQRYNLLDVKKRLDKVSPRLYPRVRPVHICTCTLPGKYKELYTRHIAEIAHGRPLIRTKAAL